MPTTAALGISYDWLPDYTEEYSAEPGATPIIKAQVQTDWSTSALEDFPSAMMGYQFKGGGRSISRSPPERHPQKTWLHCTHCNLERGLGAVREVGGAIDFFNNPAGTAGKAVWSVTFAYLGYDVAEDGGAGGEIMRWVSKKSSHSLQSLPVNGKAWKWVSDNRKIMHPTTLLFPSVQLEYKWWWVPAPLNEAEWISKIGDVNNDPFDPNTSWANYPSQTVYFQGYEKEPLIAPDGVLCYHVVFQFLVHPSGWNKAFDAKKAGGPGFADIEAGDGSGARPFAQSNLNNLFRGPA